MFSNGIGKLRERFFGRPPSLEEKREAVRKVSDGTPLEEMDLWALVNIDVKGERGLYEEVVNSATLIKRQIFNGKIFPIVPLYVSSFCAEHCLYCNYRVENQETDIIRIRLNERALAEEISYLLDRGYSAIELVYATDPALTSADIGRHLALTKESIEKRFTSSVTALNSQAFTTDGYRELADSGVDFVALWQETYSAMAYKKLHPNGHMKSDFAFRVDAPERMIEAGIKGLGMGILFGLAPVAEDFFTLLMHERYLLEKYGKRCSVLGIPRMKPARGAALREAPHPVSDDELKLMVAIHNVVFPQTLPFINTRETFELCREIAIGGGALFTFDCSTVPGGYTIKRVGYQFPTGSYPVERYRGLLEEYGLYPQFNWTLNTT